MKIQSSSNSLPQRPQVTTRGTPPSAPAPQDQVEISPLRKAFDEIHNAGGVGKARLLQDNQPAWIGRWKLLESARSSIHTQYFCFDHDALGMAMMGHLYKKAKEGVKIQMMVDATGDTFGTRGFKSHIGGKDYLQELVMTGNVEAKVYHPHWKKAIDQLLSIGSTAISASNHDKILEVDGERGITGGRNIGYEYFVHPDDFSGAWRDQDVYFEGAASALALRDAFNIEFGAPWITQKVRGDFLGNWVKRDLELLGAYKMMDLWVKGAPLSADAKGALRTSEDAREAEATALVEQALQHLPEEGVTREASRRERKSLLKIARELVGYAEMRGSYHEPEARLHDAEIKILDKTSSVGIGTDEINITLQKLARSAQKSIVIENPYVCLSQDTIDGLAEAGKRGVQIYLGTNSPASTDSAVTQAFFLRDWPRLEATIPNLTIFCATGERKLHAKTAVIDDEVTLVTTYNLDFISQHVNSEVGAVVWGKDFAKETVDGFLRDQADPRNGVVEYKILRNQAGEPIRGDGEPVLDRNGKVIHEPEVVFGPADHLPPELLTKYKTKVHRWDFLRRVIPQLNPVDTFKGVHR